ncbi:hypothetical protein Rhe02_56160 [Rhizocola hellebori]|uniref:Uncharacterized protein n=1 Tax=Rhizocola hellebori TaxID=1392758 RepID=A0A8J3QD20_9ACTN|nr:hypothetical protein [Rhizocola hellebori]GIH07549.1 hypothetical protein Rhe02_56160 [Rhizocola hellebori]
MLDSNSGGTARRSLLKTAATALGTAGLGALGSVVAFPATPASAAVPPGSVQKSSIYNFDLYYTATNTSIPESGSWWFNPDFHYRLEQWLASLCAANTTIWHPKGKIHHVGTYGEPNEFPAHPAARAIDLNSIWVQKASSTGVSREVDFYGGHQAGGAVRQRYWATVASLSGWFRHVLHYYDGGSHTTHVHVDNWVSGNAPSIFSTSSGTQVSMVQACLTYIWKRPVPIDRSWSNGGQTDIQSRWVLNSVLGLSGGLTTSQSNWQAFLAGSRRTGFGIGS